MKKQIDFESDAKEFAPTIAEQTNVVERLKAGLEEMKGKLDQLRRKRDELVGRSKIAHAEAQVHGAIKSVNILDPTSEVSRSRRRSAARRRRFAARRSSRRQAWMLSSRAWTTRPLIPR